MGFFDFLSGADEQAKAIKKATQQSIDFAREGQDRAASILAPAANFGPAQSKLYDLSGLNGAQSQQNAFSQYVESPEVQFYRDQGLEAAQRSAAARGGLMSGRTLADLSKFNQGLAQTGYGDYYNRINNLYGSALGTANNLAGVYSGGGNTLANLAMQGGSQYAQAKGAQGGVLGDLLSQGMSLAGYAAGSYLGRPGGTGSSYGSKP